MGLHVEGEATPHAVAAAGTLPGFPERAAQATAFLKALANENRLLVLCYLADGEKSVTELERLIGVRQPTLSQQLARLRAERLVKTRRNAKSVYYSLAGNEAKQVIELLHRVFCEPGGEAPAG
ncbi:MAG: helix-turn-helix transcriptional regulator [Proteobacteria bacterium]|nr:helix-turn-helix transcriptional regulator [Pseudomonadota bacterium]